MLKAFSSFKHESNHPGARQFLNFAHHSILTTFTGSEKKSEKTVLQPTQYDGRNFPSTWLPRPSLIYSPWGCVALLRGCQYKWQKLHSVPQIPAAALPAEKA